jgi:hypothetical protein
MSKRYKASFTCYLLVVLVLFGFGFRYLFASELTPYHAAALGQSLGTMTPNQQITFLTLYRVVGTGMLSTAVAMTFLLFGAFRRGEVWSRWAMTASGLCFSGLSLYATLVFKAATGIDAPWPASVASLVIVVLAHVLAIEKAKV